MQLLVPDRVASMDVASFVTGGIPLAPLPVLPTVDVEAESMDG